MQSFTIKFNNTLKLEVPGFSAADMRELGETTINAVKGRVGEARNSFDQPALPLAVHQHARKDGTLGRRTGYAVNKARKTGRSVRDLRLTGQMLDSMAVLEASEESVTIGFNNQAAAIKASINQSLDPFFVSSPRDQEQIDAKAAQLFRINLKAA